MQAGSPNEELYILMPVPLPLLEALSCILFTIHFPRLFNIGNEFSSRNFLRSSADRLLFRAERSTSYIICIWVNAYSTDILS